MNQPTEQKRRCLSRVEGPYNQETEYPPRCTNEPLEGKKYCETHKAKERKPEPQSDEVVTEQCGHVNCEYCW